MPNEMKVGDKAICDSREYKLLQVVQKAAMVDGVAKAVNIAILDNEQFQVKCLASELQYSEALKAWYLPGRIISREARQKLRGLADDKIQTQLYLGGGSN